MTYAPTLSDRVILITGASTGIGAALAEVLAAKASGIRLVLAARSQDKLDQVATICSKAGAEVLVVPTDISDVEQGKALARKAVEHFGRVDSLVNNAGYGQMGPVELVPSDAVQRQFQVNVIGPLALVQALIPGMREQGGGHIVNVSSLGGRLAFPFGGLYSGSKFALEGLSDALRMELDAFNIKVSVVEPGPVTTDFFDVADRMVEQNITDPQTSPYRAAFEKLKSLQQQTSSRSWTSERVAEVIVRVLTDKNPRPRYVAATGGDFLLFMMRKVLPTQAVDTFWKKFYGLDKVAQDWKNR